MKGPIAMDHPGLSQQIFYGVSYGEASVEAGNPILHMYIARTTVRLPRTLGLEAREALD